MEGSASQTLELELLHLLGGDEKARVIARYCGFDGRGGTTLQAVGREFGITAERVRQIVGDVVKSHATESVASPVLSEAIALIAAHTPGFAADIEEQLRNAGLSSGLFRVEGILRAAELFGHPSPFHVTPTGQARLVHSFPPESLDAIILVAHRAIERWGAATLNTVLAETRKAVPQAADKQLIRDLLISAGQLRWLDQAAEWFWLPSVTRNPLVRRIRKILSVVNPVRVGDLRAGVARDYRLQHYLPPTAALQELCRQMPGLRVAGEYIEASPRIDQKEVLGESERTILEVLVQRGGIMRRAELAAACLQNGVNRSSFYSAVGHSPVMLPDPSGRLAVVGVTCDTGSPGPVARPRSKYLRSQARAHNIRLRKWIE